MVLTVAWPAIWPDDIAPEVIPWANALLDTAKANAAADAQRSAALDILIIEILLLAARNAGSAMWGSIIWDENPENEAICMTIL
jgi:hypothetical protein